MESYEKQENMLLLNSALKAMRKAYVIWGFSVGAAVLGVDGKIYQGCNIETKISGLGICAERCAINHAICHGNREIKKVAIVIEDYNVGKVVPCGVCRQYICDFSRGKAVIIMAKAKNNKIAHESIEVKSISELLPNPFNPSNI